MNASANDANPRRPWLRNLFRRTGRSIRTRLIACFGVIVLLMIAADVVAVVQFRQIAGVGERFGKLDDTSLAVVRVHFDVASFRDRVDALASNHDTRQLASETTRIRQKFVQDVDYAEQKLRQSLDVKTATRISSALETLRVTLLSQLDTAAELANVGEWDPIRLRLASQIPALVGFSSSLVDKVDQQVLQQRAKAIEDTEQARRRLVTIVPIVGLLTLFAAAGLGWYITRGITVPLCNLTASAEALARGDFRHRVNFHGDDELAVLGKAFNYAARKLQQLYEDLRRKEQELRDVVNTVPAHVWRASPDGDVDFINDRLRQFLGLPPEDILGWTWQSVLHPDDRAEFVSQCRAAVKGGQSMQSEVRLRRADGEYCWFFIQNVPLRDEAGNVTKWYGSGIEIQDRKRAENQLRRSEAYLAEAQQLSYTGSFGWDLSSGEIYWSRETFRIFEYEPTGTVTVDLILQRTHPEDRMAVHQLIERVTQQRTALDFEHRLLMPDGSVKYVHVVGRPSENERGRPEFVGAVTDVSEYKRAEQALQRSEKQLRDVIETIPTMAWTTTPDGTNAFANKVYLEYTGLSLRDILGTGWKVSYHPADIATHLEKWRVSLETGKPFENEARVKQAKNGEYRWFLTRAVPLRDEDGNILNWYGISTDIDDRKHAEALLTGEKRILEMLAKGNSLPQILDTLCQLVEEHATGVLASILLVDDNCLRYGGAPSLPKLYAKAWDGVVIGPEVGSCGTAAYRREQVIVEDIATDPLWVDHRQAALSHSLRACWSTPIFSAQGNTIATFAMYCREPRRPSPRDQEIIEQIAHLTGVAIERKQIQDALRRSEAYLAESQRLAKTGSWAWNLRTGELFWSQELCRMYGLDPQMKPTWPWFLNRIHPDDRAKIEQQAKMESTEKDWTVSEIEFRVVLSDGTLRHVHAISCRATDGSGETTEVIGTVMDVTERKRAEEERERLRQLEADLAHINRVSMMGELAAALAHEIKQPIAAAVTNANTSLRWLARDEPDLHEARKAIMRTANDGTRAAEIVNRLRSFYMKGAPPQPELVDLNEVAREMLMLLRDEANRYSIATHAELDQELPKVMTDRVQLQQVFMNLMLNAIEAMKETAGELTIKSQLSDDGQLLISVSDTGVGLPAEKPEQIFNAFFTTKSQGTGMGLAITRSIIEAHGGRLWASANPAGGATFHFTLPSEATASSAPKKDLRIGSKTVH